MLKRVFVFVSILFLLTACSQTQKQVEEVNGLIEEEKWAEAETKIQEYDLINKELDVHKYNYHEISQFNEVVKLFETHDYTLMFKVFEDNPLQDEYLTRKLTEIVSESLNELISDGKWGNAKTFYDKLDQGIKQELSDIEQKLIQEEKDEQKRLAEIAKQREKELIDKYIEQIKDGKYSEVTMATVSSTNETFKDLYNLASAYRWYVEEDDDMYIPGIPSLPEYSLEKIIDPIDEIKDLKTSLEILIEERKKGNEGKFGVIIGMAAEDVLKSSWGEPQSKNNSSTRYGTREQWVYGNGNYLYFRDGILDSISTRQ
ncbi:hypothetical protein [Bacillus horti]|uniref:Major membrane immunogen (Membrane-anchored lipoprotein) n=1 Tax=Caldalkalibacillus horti TaxID=77523 RepID=A0ABT9W4N4_9BACI|nr:hypothetical protein [Bacillus horti]MDQ0168216.1 major membrane immunogen (membrane-anchored lipoprotein) [Bacillus horti]